MGYVMDMEGHGVKRVSFFLSDVWIYRLFRLGEFVGRDQIRWLGSLGFAMSTLEPRKQN